MAKSKIVIEMDYRKAKEQANNLEALARKLDSLSDLQLANALAGIEAAWQSDSSVDYLKKGRSLQNSIETSARNLKNAAKTIRTIAKTTYDAEMRACMLAEGK